MMTTTHPGDLGTRHWGNASYEYEAMSGHILYTYSQPVNMMSLSSFVSH